MKYFSLNTLILVGLSLVLTGCFRDYDYDITRNHDIYRNNYKYTPLPEATPTPAPGAPGDNSGAPTDTTGLGAPAPAPVAPPQPAVPPAH